MLTRFFKFAWKRFIEDGERVIYSLFGLWSVTVGGIWLNLDSTAARFGHGGEMIVAWLAFSLMTAIATAAALIGIILIVQVLKEIFVFFGTLMTDFKAEEERLKIDK